MWTRRITNTFKRQHKHLSHKLQELVNKKINELASSVDPTKLGDHKKGPIHCYRAYKIGNQYRIVYDTDFETKTIVFLKVGTHDDVYE
jgi:addiction module RelE/StbE family toxin